MGSKRSYRTHFGPVFSEGARLLWRAVERESGGREALTLRLGIARGVLSTWLYGDRRPGREKSVLLATTLRIPAAAWGMPPTEACELPATIALPSPPSSAPRLARGRKATRATKKAG